MVKVAKIVNNDKYFEMEEVFYIDGHLSFYLQLAPSHLHDASLIGGRLRHYLTLSCL
jgi:hypothetical protein